MGVQQQQQDIKKRRADPVKETHVRPDNLLSGRQTPNRGWKRGSRAELSRTQCGDNAVRAYYRAGRRAGLDRMSASAFLSWREFEELQLQCRNEGLYIVIAET